MTILFLNPYPTGQSPSQRFRFEQYLSLLEQNGVLVSSQSFWDEQTWSILYKPGYFFRKISGFFKGVARRLMMLFRLSSVDFVFVHRECLPIGPPIIEWIISIVLKRKIIYDFDDAIWLPNTSQENSIVAYLKWHNKVASICKWSHKVSCGNAYLAGYASQFNNSVIINPTTIDTENLHNPTLYKQQTDSSSLTIGWTGTHSTLPYLNSLIPVFEKIENKFEGKVRLLIIANKNPQLKLKHVDFMPWSKETEVYDLMRMDIGVMPLTDDVWAKGKCGFKALQYMALEIPSLVSPVGINKIIIDHEINGFLAADENEWFTYLKKLIQDESLRKKIGAQGRMKVIKNYSILSNGATFLSLFDIDSINNNAVDK
jgi:glycosyltransferase involved in cell wall biosynthesis